VALNAPHAHTPASAADRTGLSLDTLRYYEREGLIGPVRRMSSGQLRYSEDDLAWIGIVSCLRDAGLGIADLRRFTELLRSEHGANDRVAFLQRRRDELLERAARPKQPWRFSTAKLPTMASPDHPGVDEIRVHRAGPTSSWHGKARNPATRPAGGTASGACGHRSPLSPVVP